MQEMQDCKRSHSLLFHLLLEPVDLPQLKFFPNLTPLKGDGLASGVSDRFFPHSPYSQPPSRTFRGPSW
ncbi:MAG: hypothetical protein ACM37W_23040 [Actinomycetota bacterium]